MKALLTLYAYLSNRIICETSFDSLEGVEKIKQRLITKFELTPKYIWWNPFKYADKEFIGTIKNNNFEIKIKPFYDFFSFSFKNKTYQLWKLEGKIVEINQGSSVQITLLYTWTYLLNRWFMIIFTIIMALIILLNSILITETLIIITILLITLYPLSLISKIIKKKGEFLISEIQSACVSD